MSLDTPSDPAPAGPFLDDLGDGIAALRFDDPERSANVLSRDVMRGLDARLGEVESGIREGKIRALLIHSGKADSFIVGADISSIGAISSVEEAEDAIRQGQQVYARLAALPIPTLAAVHGVCVGGGVEMALACRYRVASDHRKTRMGLPEVQLGFLPAWGGTTRLPRLLSLGDALDLLLTGRQVDGRRARRMGLVDTVPPSPVFLDAATDFLRARMEGTPLPKAQRPFGTRLLEGTPLGRRTVLRLARRSVLERTGGHYPAPLRILEVVRASLGAPVDEALRVEARAGAELLLTPESKNLLHVFHLREGARKGEGIPSSGAARPVQRVGIVGAGVMGGGIAHLMADQGIEVRIRDLRSEAVGSALKHAQALFSKGVERRRLSRREAAARLERIAGGVDYGGFGPLDLVVEAVVEKMEVKQAVLREIEAHVGEGCVIATNTSTLSLDAMASALTHPERFVGMHFFNPVDRMPLVEVIRGSRSSEEAVSSVYHLAVRTGKTPVLVRDGPGFLVNRILGPYLNEAGHLLSEGIPIEAIDAAAEAFGMPMGPLRLVDEVGLDVARHAGDVLHAAFGDRMAAASPLVTLAGSGLLGKKGGAGFYRYEKGKVAGVNPAVAELLSRHTSVEPRTSGDAPSGTPHAIQARLILSMVNEAARVLEDGIVNGAGAVDLGMIMGTGFPPFRGGLLRYADTLGAAAVVEQLDGLVRSCGERFLPAPSLADMARQGRTFYDIGGR